MNLFNGVMCFPILVEILLQFSFVACGKISVPQHKSEQVFVITTKFSSNSSQNTTNASNHTNGYNDQIHGSSRNKRDTEPEIYSFRIQSDIRYRYSRTHVTSRVANLDKSVSKEVNFRAVLPETAYISKFSMEIDGKKYESFVQEKEEAKRTYNEARRRGESAGLVALNTRHSNVFNVNVNIKAQSKISFELTYEELLTRKLGYYQQKINISPEQIYHVKDIQIVVNIEETQNITFVRVPNLQNDVEVEQDAKENNKDVVIVRPSGNRANIFWSPSVFNQTTLSKQEIVEEFTVEYDINRKSNDGEVLVMQGYFVHFFAPTDLKPLRKHVIFILDISGSMSGRKIEQMIESQIKILDDLSADDFFNIITFSRGVSMYSPLHSKSEEQPIAATKANVDEAKIFISSLKVEGGTNIHGAITRALELIENIKNVQTQKSQNSFREVLPENVESLIIFLTDGEPTEGITDLSEIENRIKKANRNLSVPIYSLAFGNGADFQFLRKLSLQNYGFARKIYEASDSTLQLTGFYNEISSPVLSHVRFQYTSPKYRITDVSTTKFQTVFNGTEIVIAGKLTPLITSSRNIRPIMQMKESLLEKSGRELLPVLEKPFLNVAVPCFTREGPTNFINPEIFSRKNPWGVIDVPAYPPSPTPSSQEDQFLDRLWAYLTVKQLIDKDLAAMDGENINNGEISSPGKIPTTKETPKQQALRLALKYSFVTSLTSLVVVKPNDTRHAKPHSIHLSSGDDDDIPIYDTEDDLPRPPTHRKHTSYAYLKPVDPFNIGKLENEALRLPWPSPPDTHSTALSRFSALRVKHPGRDYLSFSRNEDHLGTSPPSRGEDRSNHSNTGIPDYYDDEDYEYPLLRHSQSSRVEGQLKPKRIKIQSSDEDSDIDTALVSSSRKSKYDNILEQIQNMTNSQNQMMNNINVLLKSNEDFKILTDSLQKETQFLHNKVYTLESENERFGQELRKRNLIIFGLDDAPDEDEETTKSKVIKFLSAHLNLNDIIIDMTQRISKFVEGKQRAVRIQLLLLNEKELILSQFQKLKTITNESGTRILISEDLPLKTRQCLKVLRGRFKEALSKNPTATIDYARFQITVDGKIFKVNNNHCAPAENNQEQK